MCNIPIEERIEEFKKALKRLCKSHGISITCWDEQALSFGLYHDEFNTWIDDAYTAGLDDAPTNSS